MILNQPLPLIWTLCTSCYADKYVLRSKLQCLRNHYRKSDFCFLCNKLLAKGYPCYAYNLAKSVALLYINHCILSPNCVPSFLQKEDNHNPYGASEPVNRLEGGGHIVFPYKDLVDYKINHYDQSSKPILDKFKCFNVILLTFVEKMMIARVHHSYCFIKVAVSWRMKMKANVVCFSNPIPKVYNILPPAREELDAVIAFMYTGPCKPTPDELQRTPLLVRLNKVRNALEWLKLNHQDYKDLDISDTNLATYKDNDVPVGYDYDEL